MKVIIVIFFVLFLYSCCWNVPEPIITQYNLKEVEKKIIPYQLNQELIFKSSYGNTIKIKVNEIKQEIVEDWGCAECFCEQDHDAWEFKSISILSGNPSLELRFNIGGRLQYNDTFQLSIGLKNKSNFHKTISFDSLGNFTKNNEIFHDSILINSKYYYNVVESDAEYPYGPVDTIHKEPSKLFVNNKGLLKFTIRHIPNLEYYWIE